MGGRAATGSDDIILSNFLHMKWPRHFLSYALTRNLSTVLRTQGDGTWRSDKFLSHDVTKHIFGNAFACWNKWA